MGLGVVKRGRGPRAPRRLARRVRPSYKEAEEAPQGGA